VLRSSLLLPTTIYLQTNLEAIQYTFVVSFSDYSVEREHGGLRRIAGYGVTVTRGAASAMMFTFSSLLVTMCRNLITFLRETFVGHYVPFDSNVLFHKYIAFWALFFTGKFSILYIGGGHLCLKDHKKILKNLL
jgi:hypothetical protein